MLKKRDAQGLSAKIWWKMKDLIEIIKNSKKNKSADFVGGFSMVVKIAITLIAGGLFFWLVVKMMRRYV